MPGNERPAGRVNKNLNLTAEVVERVRTYRFEHRLPSETAAIEELIVLGLGVVEKRRAKQPVAERRLAV